MEKLVYRMKDLTQVLGLSKTTLYVMVNTGEFPKPIELGPHSVGWPSGEVKEWVASRNRRESLTA